MDERDVCESYYDLYIPNIFRITLAGYPEPYIALITVLWAPLKRDLISFISSSSHILSFFVMQVILCNFSYCCFEPYNILIDLSVVVIEDLRCTVEEFFL